MKCHSYGDSGLSMRARRLLTGIKEKCGLGLDQMIADAGLTWSRMRFWRLLKAQDEWTPQTLAPFISMISNHAGIPERDIWAFLSGETTAYVKLLELACCRFFRPTRQSLFELAALIGRAVTAQGRWEYAGRLLPIWCFPEDTHAFCIRALLRDLGVSDRSVATGWMEWCRLLHDLYFPNDSDALAPIAGTVLATHGDLLEFLAGYPPMDLLDDFDRGDCVDAVTRAIPNRGGRFGLLGNTSGSRGTSTLRRLQCLDSLLVVDGRFLLKRERGSAVWSTCERSGDPLSNHYLDAQIAFISELKRFVRWGFGGSLV